MIPFAHWETTGEYVLFVQRSLRSWELRTENEDERARWVRIFHEQGAKVDTSL